MLPSPIYRGLTDIPTLSYVKSELQYFESLFYELDLSYTDFLHCDPHGHNIVYDSKTGLYGHPKEGGNPQS